MHRMPGVRCMSKYPSDERDVPTRCRWLISSSISMTSGGQIRPIITWPFRFTGKLHKLALKIEPPVLTEAGKQKLTQAHRNNAASQ